MQQDPKPPAQGPEIIPPLKAHSLVGRQFPTSPEEATQFPGPI